MRRPFSTEPEQHEWLARAIALPIALILGWFAAQALPGPVRLIGMWVHETGHAMTAWLCGYLAWPGPWFTPIDGARSPMFTLVLLGTIGWGAWRAWQIERWFWVAVAAAALLLIVVLTVMTTTGTAQQLITFGGDAGNFVLGTALMLTVYARADHPVRQNQLRWGLLAIGALAFMDTLVVWTGPLESLPFGENENGLSDPSVLVEGYGWTVTSLVARYRNVAFVCLGILAVAYVTGLLRRDRSIMI